MITLILLWHLIGQHMHKMHNDSNKIAGHLVIVIVLSTSRTLIYFCILITLIVGLHWSVNKGACNNYRINLTAYINVSHIVCGFCGTRL